MLVVVEQTCRRSVDSVYCGLWWAGTWGRGTCSPNLRPHVPGEPVGSTQRPRTQWLPSSRALRLRPLAPPLARSMHETGSKQRSHQPPSAPVWPPPLGVFKRVKRRISCGLGVLFFIDLPVYLVDCFDHPTSLPGRLPGSRGQRARRRARGRGLAGRAAGRAAAAGS